MKRLLIRAYTLFSSQSTTFYLILIIAGIFSIIVFPLCLINNDYLNLVTANYVDSGSILSGILDMLSTVGNNSFYNQNLIFHGVYGYPYNSTVFLMFCILKFLIGISTTDHFKIYASFARLTSLMIAVLTIFQIYKIGVDYLNRWYSRVAYVLLAITFPPFFFSSFQMKQDLFGLFFSLLCFHNLYEFHVHKNRKILWKSIVFFTLAVLNKQPFIFLIFPISLIVVNRMRHMNKLVVLMQLIKGATLSLLLSFLIHPYLFLDFKGFVYRQSILFNGNIAQSMTVTFYEWLAVIQQSNYLILLSVTPFILLIVMGVSTLFKQSIFPKNTIQLLFSFVIYSITYLIWLVMKVGPLKYEFYFLPIYPYSLLLVTIMIERPIDVFVKFIVPHKFSKIHVYFPLVVHILVIYLLGLLITMGFQPLYKIYAENHNFKEKSNVLIAQRINISDFGKSNTAINIMHTVTIPINSQKFGTDRNTWQLGDSGTMKKTICITFKPDVVVIDKKYPYENNIKFWTEIMLKCNFKNRYSPSSDFALFY